MDPTTPARGRDEEFCKPPVALDRSMHVPTDAEILWLEMWPDLLGLDWSVDPAGRDGFDEDWSPSRSAPEVCSRWREENPNFRIGWVDVHFVEGRSHGPQKLLLPVLLHSGEHGACVSVGYFDWFWINESCSELSTARTLADRVAALSVATPSVLASMGMEPGDSFTQGDKFDPRDVEVSDV